MRVSLVNPVLAERITAEHARTLLRTWEPIFDSGVTLDAEAMEALETCAELYGVHPHPEPEIIWRGLKARLETYLASPVAPGPSDLERVEIKRARRSTDRRPVPPMVRQRAPGPDSGLVPSHADGLGWQAQMATAFGTRSMAVIYVFISQLAALVSDNPAEPKINAAIAMVSSMKPRTEMEAALLAQMVAIHWLFMDAVARTHVSNPKGLGAVAKLAHTFAEQMGVWSRIRGRTIKQDIRVKYERHNHQHVHMHGGGAENGTQPHVPNTRRAVEIIPALEHAGGPALSCEDEGGNVVPGPGRKRASPVS